MSSMNCPRLAVPLAVLALVFIAGSIVRAGDFTWDNNDTDGDGPLTCQEFLIGNNLTDPNPVVASNNGTWIDATNSVVS